MTNNDSVKNKSVNNPKTNTDNGKSQNQGRQQPNGGQGNARTQVIKTLIHVQNGLSLSNMLDGLLRDASKDNKSFVHNLLYTTLRHWHATARLLDSLADKPVDEIEVRTTIQVGITQLIYLEVADHASIFETVEAVKELGFARASSLVNAILRKVAKNPAKYRKQCDKKHSLPNWLAKQLKQDWREQYDELCKGLRVPAPMFLRVNQREMDVDGYLQQLSEAEIDAEAVSLEVELEHIHTGKPSIAKPIQLSHSQSVSLLPNFAEGAVSVQDAHAHLAGTMVKALVDDMLTKQSVDNASDENIHILDACTAPSGKLAHCLESFDSQQIVKVAETKVGQDSEGKDKFLLIHDEQSTGRLQFTAIDNEANRLQRSQQNLSRLNQTDEAKLVCADAIHWQLNPQQPEQFDVILLDAPCTATGVMRRHPDIGLLRQETDVAQTVELQKQILDNLWSQLKPNGYLVYATCSILKAENVAQMQGFIEEHSNATAIKIDGNWGIEQTIGRQCLPLGGVEHDRGGDGFYYAILQKS